MTGIRPLTGPDAAIMNKLLQVVAIAERNNWGTAADIVRIAEAHLPHPNTLRRQLLNERAARNRAEAENDRLQAKVRQLAAIQNTPAVQSPQPRRVVKLTPNRHAVLQLMAAGYSRKQIADRLGLGREAVADRIRHTIRAFGVTRTAEVIQLVHSKQVEVRTLVPYEALSQVSGD